MVVVIFRMRAREGALPELGRTAQRMQALAADQPGFVAYKHFMAADGESLALATFERPEHAEAWRVHPEHQAVQARAREALLASYHVQICDLVRERQYTYEPATALEG